MIFAALTFLVVAVLGSVSVAGVRAWRLWRTLQRASEQTGGALDRLAAQGAVTEQRAMGLTGNSERLDKAVERLRRTLAAFAIIRTAAAEPRALYDSIIGAVPRK